MPPKAKPKGKAKAEPKAAPVSKSPEPAAPPPPPPPAIEVPSAKEAAIDLNFVDDEHWAALAGLEEPPECVAKVLQAVLVLLGDPEPGSWSVAKAALSDAPELLRELKALGPCGCSAAQLKAAEDLVTGQLHKLKAPEEAKEEAKPKAKAKGKAAPAPKAEPPPPGAPAAFALGLVVLALAKHNRDADDFEESWQTVKFAQLHDVLESAAVLKTPACIVCPGPAAHRAVTAFLRGGGASVESKPSSLQVRVGLAKDLTVEGAQAAFAMPVQEAVAAGRRCVVMLGSSPVPIAPFCNEQHVPANLFKKGADGEAAAKAVGKGAAKDGFHVVVVVEMLQAKAQEKMEAFVPNFGDVQVFVIDPASLPAPETFEEAAPAAGSGRAAVKAKPCLRAALRLLAVEPPEVPKPKDGEKPPAAAAPEPADDDRPFVNDEEFEWTETFTADSGWETRWQPGPSKADEHGKPIREGLIKATIQNYPPDPKVRKACLELVGGTSNAPCTGIYTTFEPLCRPTEVEFEFTMNGKVEMPNANIVFTELPFDGALPDCRVGVQFAVRGGMQLSGGAGNLVRISNDGKIKNDQWNKVLLKIDWNEKIVIGQVDTRGKGYMPAVQTVPFRDEKCQGFGACFIYNTDLQATSWFSSIRIKQEANADIGDTAALDARAEMAKKLKQKDYDAAVAADMAVGMKMGAIKSTACHGMNLAQEQAANYASAAGAAMGR
eukprot:TRINITY_DN73613_c0_g1_i1.p1 TRINITY_DN73613_c0_g1~~TRINITY_DN73613_c0_g1_i1.p1  ORF type:complete len:717 (-),score=247.47 TRINITY_DN73613_c0_g1_i1:99-2249(-)